MPGSPALKLKETPDNDFSPEESAEMMAQKDQAQNDLAKARAAKRRALALAEEQKNIADQSAAPELLEADLISQEYGRPTEDNSTSLKNESNQNPDSENEAEPNEELADQNWTENSPEQSDLTPNQPQNLSPDVIKQIQSLNQRKNSLINDAKNIEKKNAGYLEPLKKAWKKSARTDGASNALKLLRYIGALTVEFFITIIVPILAFFAVLVVLIAWAAGFPLGPPTPKTLKLKMDYEEAKKRLAKLGQDYRKTNAQEIRSIDLQINKLTKTA